MHLISCWNPQIIYIITSIYKNYAVKFIVFIAYSYSNYFIISDTSICKTMYLNLSYLYHYSNLWAFLNISKSPYINLNLGVFL